MDDDGGDGGVVGFTRDDFIVVVVVMVVVMMMSWKILLRSVRDNMLMWSAGGDVRRWLWKW